MAQNAAGFCIPEIGHADFNFAEFPSLIQQSSTDLNLTEKDSSDYGSCKNNFLSSSNSSDADSGTNRYESHRLALFSPNNLDPNPRLIYFLVLNTKENIRQMEKHPQWL